MMRKAMVALAVLGLSALGMGPASASITVGHDDGDRCRDATASSARVRPGAHVEEPGALTVAQQQAFERESRSRMQQLRFGRASDLRALAVRVPVHVHIIRRDDGSGGVTDATVARQVTALNRAFSGSESPGVAADTPFRFVLASTDRTDETAWYNWDAPNRTGAGDDPPAKRALHKGGYDALNIYVASLSDGLLGYAYLPDGPLVPDGVVVHKDTLPGGSFAPYNRGDTVTHEVGHWLGLYHTFENGCRQPGDRVADTPGQHDGNAVAACRPTLNTCTAPGRDPVHNYMNYTDDVCLDQFTPGQSSRMADQWLAYRDPERR